MSYYSPHSHAYPTARPPQTPQSDASWGTGTSTTLVASSYNAAQFPKEPGSDAMSDNSWGIPSHLSWPSSLQSASVSSSKVGSPAVHQGSQVRWDTGVPPSMVSGTMHTPSSPSIFNDHVRQMQPSAGAFRPHPFFAPGQLWCDFAFPPSMQQGAPNYNPKMKDAAFYPSSRYVFLRFDVNPMWTLRIEHTQDLTVFVVLSQIFNFLQLYDSPDVAAQTTYHGRSSRGTSAQQFHAGCRRIDALGQRRVFYGLIPTGEPHNSWRVCFSEPNLTPGFST